MERIGDRVQLTRMKSVRHFEVMDMPIVGELIKVDFEHSDGVFSRPYLIRFDDKREGWLDAWEFKYT